jgi:hypothetical protein
MKTQKKFNNLKRPIFFILSISFFVFSVIPFTLAIPLIDSTVHTIELQIDNPYMCVDGVTMKIDLLSEATPIIVPSWKRTMVPLRGILEHMRASVGWDAKTKTIMITQQFSSTEIILQVHNPKAIVQGEECWIDEQNHQVSPFILHQRTYIPVLFVSKSLDAKVLWNPKGKLITIEWEEP